MDNASVKKNAASVIVFRTASENRHFSASVSRSAQTELTQKATKVGINVGYLVAGGAVGYAALLIILAAVVIGLAQLIRAVTEWEYVTSAWISAAIVGLVVGAVAYMLVTSRLPNSKTLIWRRAKRLKRSRRMHNG